MKKKSSRYRDPSRWLALPQLQAWNTLAETIRSSLEISAPPRDTVAQNTQKLCDYSSYLVGWPCENDLVLFLILQLSCIKCVLGDGRRMKVVLRKQYETQTRGARTIMYLLVSVDAYSLQVEGLARGTDGPLSELHGRHSHSAKSIW